jgi:hypothetical protein
VTIIFVYNANSGLLNILFDVSHKLISPKTYPCSLCALTYNVFKENKTWLKFRKTTSAKFKFLHKDEFEKQYLHSALTYPVVIKKESEQLTTLLSHSDLNSIRTVEELIAKLKGLI